MKKFLILILTIALISVFAVACGQSGGGDGAPVPAEFDPDQADTMGDVFLFEDPENAQEAYYGNKYVYVLKNGETYYRAVCVMPEEVSEAIEDIDFEDEDREQKVRDLISPLPIDVLENLNEQIPSQEELDEYVGKTGQDLFDEGWTYWAYDLEDMKAGMEFGPFSYRVDFEYDGEQMENTDDFDFYEEFKDLKINSVVYEGIGDAANIGFDD